MIRCLTDNIILQTAYSCPAWMGDCPDILGNEALPANPLYWQREEYLFAPVMYLLPTGEIVTLQPEFPTDGASIPSIFLVATGTPYDRRLIRGALIHDWLYASNYVPRDVADDYLRQLWINDGVDHAKAWAMYQAVRVGGASSYNDSTPGKGWYSRFGVITPALATSVEIQTARDIADPDAMPLTPEAA